MNIKNETLQKIAMHAMLPGLTYAFEQSLEELNQVRYLLDLPPVQVELVNNKRKGHPLNSTKALLPASEPEAKQPTKKQVAVNKKRSKMASKATRADWALIKRAGLTSAYRPSTELKEKARKILAARGK